MDMGAVEAPTIRRSQHAGRRHLRVSHGVLDVEMVDERTDVSVDDPVAKARYPLVATVNIQELGRAAWRHSASIIAGAIAAALRRYSRKAIRAGGLQ